MRILYAGDSPVGGPANYFLGVLRHFNAKTTHLAPSQALQPQSFEKKFDAVIFSDYSARQCSDHVQQGIIRAVQEGMGFLMVGGWGSFSGPFGKWKKTPLESILPVSCLSRDDRTNFPGGAAIQLKRRHAILGDFSNQGLPVICGMNQVIPRSGATVVLAARKIIHGRGLQLEKKEYPLLVVNSGARMRTAVLTTDAAPHWCGGMVDWGTKTLTLPVAGEIKIQVGDAYVRFLSSIIRWLASKSS